MPSGLIPAYAYRPTGKSGDPLLRTCASTRSRLFAGGTYFRSRDLGLKSNLIAVEVIEYDATDAVCVVTNYGLVTAEVVTGPVTTEIFDIHLASLKKIVIDQLDQPAARAREYSISFKIAPPAPVFTELGSFSLAKLFSAPGKLAAKFTPATPVFTPADVITVTPRKRVYRLVSKTVTPTDPPGPPASGWDIADLRAQVNASDPWIEMLERSGDAPGEGGLPPVPNPSPADVQDHGVDDAFLTPFAEARLGGGDGLPDSPDREATGPMRSLVHVNYGEAYNGSLTGVNVVYEWIGNSSNEGSWKSY